MAGSFFESLHKAIDFLQGFADLANFKENVMARLDDLQVKIEQQLAISADIQSKVTAIPQFLADESAEVKGVVDSLKAEIEGLKVSVEAGRVDLEKVESLIASVESGTEILTGVTSGLEAIASGVSSIYSAPAAPEEPQPPVVNEPPAPPIGEPATPIDGEPAPIPVDQ